MPVRFVEVSNPLEVARLTRQLGTPEIWDSFNFSFGDDASNATRFVRIPSTIHSPRGLARILFIISLVLYSVNYLAVRAAAKREVALYGHAHRD